MSDEILLIEMIKDVIITGFNQKCYLKGERCLVFNVKNVIYQSVKNSDLLPAKSCRVIGKWIKE